MDYNRYGRVAPTTTGGGSKAPLPSLFSNQRYITGQSLPECRALPHMQGRHLGASGARAMLSPYDFSLQFPQVVPGSSGRVNDFSEPMGKSIREPYRESIRVPLWDPMRAREPNRHQEVPIRGLIRRDPELELALRERDRISSHAPFYQHWSRPQPLIARNIDETASSTARMVAQPKGITGLLERGDRLASSRSRDPQQKQNLQVRPKKQGLEHESKKKTAEGLQPKLTERLKSDIRKIQDDNTSLGPPLEHESKKKTTQGIQPKLTKRSQSDIPTTQNDNAPKIPGPPGWCSLCNVDCVTKEVLHKYHVNGKKHQSNLKKLEVSGDGKKSVHEEVRDKDSCIAKRKRHMKEEGSLSSPKRQKVSILSLECKICNKEFSSQVVLESHLSGKKHAAQLKKIGNSAASLEVSGDQSRKSVCVDGKQSEISKLVVVAENDAEAAGSEEEKAVLKANDDREIGVKIGEDNSKESAVKIEEDDSKESAEPCEVDGKINNAPRGKVEEVAVTNNVKVKVEPVKDNIEVAEIDQNSGMENNKVGEKSKAHVECMEQV